MRLVEVADLPDHVWNATTQHLTLPSALGDAYREMIIESGLLDAALAAGNDEDGPVGGVREEEAKRHFAQRFSSSCARVQIALVDPKGHLGEASNRLFHALAGGRVTLLDIPCGAGAATATLLLTIAALRRARVIPSLPLDVFVVGGDFSIHARNLCERLMSKIDPALRQAQIFVRHKHVEWDVCDPVSTTSLIQNWTSHGVDCDSYLVVAANFSGFLEKERKFDQAKPQLEEIFRWVGLFRSDVIWIEPQTNVAKDHFFPRLIRVFTGYLKRLFLPAKVAEQATAKSTCHCPHPLAPTHALRVNLTLMRLDRTNPR
ncbi:hypothetical protein CfE428DRAFT_0551 [Chthoniobacter flavus Ellin428]|uniref:Uncharacterized protein n=1 Tax=Chthoniobacter flavus Ellin428 TaxID=497964 RepID=B4CV38_9BACT|nr:hypothetical protein [Chthoniobacter flavus]EDY22426.1 hypothetical protein CfE428DRAFT_0551 [Chthoniobacter flavus Ellin428]TCO94564.1 hypothetical protein EV701_10231 [Chthoniobacter flavus]